MLNENYRITERDSNTAFIEWTSANADDISFIYVNGTLQAGPIIFGTQERFAYVRFSKTLNKCIEVHDFETAVLRKNVCIQENSHPIIEWNAVPDTSKYRIYHTPFGESETLMQEVNVIDSTSMYRVRTQTQLADGWHLFRVESVSIYGVESTRLIWAYQVFRVPTPVNDLDIADGSGPNLFDITIS